MRINADTTKKNTFCICWNLLARRRIDTREGFFKDFFVLWTSKRKFTCEEWVEHYSKSPNVCLLVPNFWLFSLDYFRSHIRGSAAVLVRFLRFYFNGKAKVNKFCFKTRCNEYVFKFNVSVSNILIMQILQCLNHLFNYQF